MSNQKSLVVYFSITGVTGSMASRLASAIGADLFEITAEHPIREEASKEEALASQELRFLHKDMTLYDRIYVGLPIWWYAAPTIIHDFLSQHDLRGKTLIPFVTSGGGGLDKVRPRLLECCQGADLQEASLLSEDMSQEMLQQWADSFLSTHDRL